MRIPTTSGDYCARITSGVFWSSWYVTACLLWKRRVPLEKNHTAPPLEKSSNCSQNWNWHKKEATIFQNLVFDWGYSLTPESKLRKLNGCCIKKTAFVQSWPPTRQLGCHFQKMIWVSCELTPKKLVRIIQQEVQFSVISRLVGSLGKCWWCVITNNSWRAEGFVSWKSFDLRKVAMRK